MPQRILALEIEDADVKAALLETSFRDYHIAGLFHDSLTPEGGPVPEQVRRFLERYQLVGETVVSTIPGRLVAHRVFFLPFRDRKRLNQTVPFELETQVPFGLDEVIVDYQVLHRDSSGSTVLAALVQKPDLEAHLALLQAAGIDPKVVDFAPLSALNVLRVLGEDLPPTFAFVDFGRDGANVGLYRHEQLAGLRALSLGGLVAGNGASRNGRLDAEPLPKNEPSEEALRAVAVELRWSLAVINGAPLDERLPCYVAGPPSFLDRIGPVLERELSLEVRRLDRTSLRAVPAETRAALPECAIPLGVALREVSPANTLGLNFRRAEFSYHRGQQEVRRALGRVAILAGVLLVLGVVNIFFAYQLQVSRLAAVNSQIRYVFQETLKGQPAVDPPGQMQSEVDRLEQKVKLLGGIVSLSGAAAIDVMRSITGALPANVKLDIDEYIFDPDAVRIRGKTDEFETVDKIKQNLVRVPYFKDVQVKDVKASHDGKGVSFRLILSMANDAHAGAVGD